MNFQHLEYFNELAETQYMAQAAEKLNPKLRGQETGRGTGRSPF